MEQVFVPVLVAYLCDLFSTDNILHVVCDLEFPFFIDRMLHQVRGTLCDLYAILHELAFNYS